MRNYYVALLLFFVASACTTELQLDFDEPSKKLVLYPILTNEKRIAVKLSAPSSILTNSFPILKNGRVIINENNNPVDTIVINEKGNGVSDIIPVPGHIYRFIASAEGFPDAICDTELPEKIESLTADTVHIDFYGSKYMMVQLKISDDPDLKNYYRTIVYIKPGKVPPQLYSNIPDQGFFRLVDNRYFLAQDVIDIGEGPRFDYNYGPDVYYQGHEFFFSDELLNGNIIAVNIIVGSSIYSFSTQKYILEVSAISEEYYLGVKSYARYSVKESSDLPISEEVSIFSSVKGGYGFPLASTTTIDSSYFLLRY